MRARSACRAWSASSRCSASARRARSCSDTTSCRRARTNIPHATTAANIAVVVTVKIHHATGSPLIRTFCGRTTKNSPAVTTLSRPMSQRRLHAAMHRNGEHGDRRGHRSGHREDRQQRRQHRHPDRETAAQPQRGTRDHPEHTVDDQHERRWGRLVGGRRGEEGGADDGRQHHTDHVDGPVPTAAADVPPRLVVSPVEFEQGRRDQAGMVRAGGRPVDGNGAGHAISLSSPTGAGNRPSAVFAAPARRRKAPSGTTKGGSARRAEPSNGGPDDVVWPMRQGRPERRRLAA